MKEALYRRSTEDVLVDEAVGERLQEMEQYSPFRMLEVIGEAPGTVREKLIKEIIRMGPGRILTCIEQSRFRLIDANVIIPVPDPGFDLSSYVQSGRCYFGRNPEKEVYPLAASFADLRPMSFSLYENQDESAYYSDALKYFDITPGSPRILGATEVLWVSIFLTSLQLEGQEGCLTVNKRNQNVIGFACCGNTIHKATAYYQTNTKSGNPVWECFTTHPFEGRCGIGTRFLVPNSSEYGV